MTSSRRVMIQSSHLIPELTNIAKEGVQGQVPGLFERLLGVPAGWDSLSNSRSGLRLFEQIWRGKLLTEHHNLGWIWIWRSSAAREAGRRALRRTDNHFAQRTD